MKLIDLIEKELQPADLTRPIKRSGDRSRVDTFIDKVEKGEPFKTSDGSEVVIKLSPEVLQGMKQDSPILPKSLETEDGERIPWKKLEKTDELGAAPINMGNIAEGILGVALAARFYKRPVGNIDVQDVFSVADSLIKVEEAPKKKGKKKSSVSHSYRFERRAPDQSGNVKDHVVLKIRLSEKDIAIVRDPAEREKKTVMKTVRSAVRWANQARIKEYAEFYYQNAEANTISIRSDGLSAQTSTKADITVWVDDEPIHLNISLKAQSTRALGQVAGTGFGKQKTLWKSMFGLNIDHLKDEFERRAKKSEWYAIDHVYEQVADMFNEKWLEGDNDRREFEFLKAVGAGLKHYGALNERGLVVVHLGKNVAGDFDEITFDNVEEKLKKVDLEAQLHPTSKRPRIDIVDRISGELLFNIRVIAQTKADGTPYPRNFVEKGPLLSKLLKIEATEEDPTPAPERDVRQRMAQISQKSQEGGFDPEEPGNPEPMR